MVLKWSRQCKDGPLTLTTQNMWFKFKFKFIYFSTIINLHSTMLVSIEYLQDKMEGSVLKLRSWFEHNGPQDHLLSDLDGPAHFLLITDHWAIGYFDPCKG